jgi:chromosomal replication initiation ATPase DnaA
MKEAEQTYRRPNYYELQNNLDKVIGKFGLEKANSLLITFLDKTAVRVREHKQVKILITFIMAQVSEVFDISETDLVESNIPECKDARMVCYYLLMKFTQLSYARIGQIFDNRKRRHVMYYCHRCSDILRISTSTSPFIDKYNLIELNVIDFMGKL